MAVANQSTVRVEGLAGLRRAFIAASREESKRLISTLKEAVEPVREEASTLAASRLRQGAIPWHEMRTGVTVHSVYIAPLQRQTKIPGRKRKSLAPILLDQAMIPALERNAGDVERDVDQMLGIVARVWETTP